MRADLERAVHYFASLPVTDPDGSRGVALHMIYREPIPTGEENKPWWELGDRHHPASHRGITHYMVVSDAGGGQSSKMGDRGGCGAHALYATFLHEFGHQLGLDHTGYWGPVWCPLYPSMMNYAYSYQLDGKPENIGYSDGSLASIVLDERHLSERLPFPMSKIKFLSGPPYRYRLKPAPDGAGTLVDWNWNGIFGEENVAADINYGYSTTGGLRHTIGKTYTAPAPVMIGRGRDARLVVIFGRLAKDAPRPPADATAAKPGVSPDQPGRLLLRLWQGRNVDRDGDRWSDEQTIESAGLTGDPSAVSLDESAWVAYPTTTGVHLRSINLSRAGTPVAGPIITIPDTAGAQPTLATVAGKLALLLWRDRSRPVGVRFLSPSVSLTGSPPPPRPGEEAALDIRSNAPVGAAAGAPDRGQSTLWIGFSQDQDSARPPRWRVERLRLAAGVNDLTAAPVLKSSRREWIGGEKGGERGSSRIALLWERAGPGKDGQLFFFSNGAFGSDRPWSCHYVSTRIADRSVNGGWLTRRYYDEWTESRSGPGVCFFRGDIALAVRWFGDVHGWDNDNLFVAFHGRGIESEKMGDFDDIGLIRDVGMAHSIVDVSE